MITLFSARQSLTGSLTKRYAMMIAKFNWIPLHCNHGRTDFMVPELPAPDLLVKDFMACRKLPGGVHGCQRLP
eukprot:598579-Hanusia_phi.AAC.1